MSKGKHLDQVHLQQDLCWPSYADTVQLNDVNLATIFSRRARAEERMLVHTQIFRQKWAQTTGPEETTGALTAANGSWDGRYGLGQYISNPKKYDQSVAIHSNDSFVAINDLFPKSNVHCLLPRSVKHTDLHPFEAFEDAEFLTTLRVEAQKLKVLVVKELQRKFGPVSKQDEAREAVLNGSLDADVLPIGRDWENEVKVGVHADPSMNHLHIQVISVDRVLGGTQASEKLQQFRDAVLCGFGWFPVG